MSYAYSITLNIIERGARKRDSTAFLCVQALEAIQQLRATLKANGGQYLLGKLSYADVVMAIAVAGMCPPGKPRELPPARRTVQMQSQEVYDACKDLQAWADDLLDKHLP